MEINTGAARISSAERFRTKTASFISEFNSWLKSACEERMVPHIDLYSAFGSPGKPDLLDPRYALGDNAHINLEGHKRIAEVIFSDYFSQAEQFSVTVCLGDSHTQGYPLREPDRNGVPVDISIDSPNQYPYWLVKTTGRSFINRGLAGNTLYGMRNRFDREVLPHLPDHCIVQGGTNDALLGTPLEESKEDVIWILDRCIENDITPVVANIIPLGF